MTYKEIVGKLKLNFPIAVMQNMNLKNKHLLNLIKDLGQCQLMLMLGADIKGQGLLNLK